MNQIELPEGWLKVKIDEVADIVAGGTPSAGDDSNFAVPGKGIAWLTPADLSGYKLKEIANGKRDLSQKGYDSSSAKLMPKGSVLFSSRAPIGYVAIAANEISTNQGFKSFVFRNIDSSYAYFYLRSIRDVAESLGTGTTFKELSGAAAKTLPFVFPPLAEQKVIADKLDTLLAQVESIKTRLERIPEILKQFRQSVLAAAVSGKLTEEWRANKQSKFEIDSLTNEKLSLIKAKLVKKDLHVEVGEEIFDLPEGWETLALQSFATKITDGEHSTPKRESSGHYLLSARNVRDGFLDLSNVDYVGNEEFLKLRKRCDPDEGDILISCSGSVGRISLVDRSNEYVMVRSAALVKIMHQFLNNKYLMYVLQSPLSQKQIEEKSKSTAQANLFLSQIKELSIPCPSIEEQMEIVRLIDHRFTVTNSIEQQVLSALDRVKNLTQSILAKAFRGELTAEWREAHRELISGENSAEGLLDRIKAERELAKSATKRGRGKS